MNKAILILLPLLSAIASFMASEMSLRALGPGTILIFSVGFISAFERVEL